MKIEFSTERTCFAPVAGGGCAALFAVARDPQVVLPRMASAPE